MASAALNDDDIITGINVTPLVDVTLVLLVILMVTASYVASRSIPMELPHSATSEGTPTTLTVSIDKEGRTFLDAEAIDEPALVVRIRAARGPQQEGKNKKCERSEKGSATHVFSMACRHARLPFPAEWIG